MSHRVISGLRWARPCERPKAIPQPRLRGAPAAGLRYENRLARALPSALHGQWFEFEDSSGHGYCQPDLILNYRPKAIVVMECKYTWTYEAYEQLRQLYIPILKHVYKQYLVLGIIVAKKLNPEAIIRGVVVADLHDAIAASIAPTPSTWHWLGRAAPATGVWTWGKKAA